MVNVIRVHARAVVVGHAYLFAFISAMLAPTVGCGQALGDMIIGEPLAPFDIEAKLRQRLTLLNTPGLVGLALAGIVMAAWDAYAKTLGLPLVRALGGQVKPVRAYHSCGLWLQEPASRADGAEQWLAEEEFTALKIRMESGHVVIPDRPGCGIEWHEDAVSQYRMP